MHCVRVLFALLAASLLSACALKPIPYDRSSASDVKTIGIVTPAMPNRPAVVLASSVGQSFGLIGALADAAMQDNRETTFRKAIEPTNFSATDICLQELKTQLQEHGYDSVMVTADRSKHDFLEKYPADQEPKVDAYLDLVISYGYIAAGVGKAPYRPIVYLTARLVRASDASVLMQDAVSYNPVGPFGKNSQSITLPPDPTYQFADFDTLAADPNKAAKGMETALGLSSRTFGQLLK